jgi:hypothetical protein
VELTDLPHGRADPRKAARHPDFTFFLIYTEKSGKTYFTEIGAAVVPGRNELPAGLEITGTRTFSASG